MGGFIIEKYPTDVILATIITIFCSLGLSVIFSLGVGSVVLILVILLPIIISILYIFKYFINKSIEKRPSDVDHNSNTTISRMFKLLLICILILISITVLIFTTFQYRRPMIFFILIILIIALIIIISQYIAGSRIRLGLTILATIYVIALLRFTIQPLYSLETNSDAWFHVVQISSISANGSVPSDIVYGNFPIYHLLNALTLKITNVPIHYIEIISVGIPLLIVSILIFSIVNRIFNMEVAIVGWIIYLVFPINTYFGWVLTPVALCIAYIIIITFFLFVEPDRLHSKIIFMILVAVVIITNIVGSVFLGVLLTCYSIGVFLSNRIISKTRNVTYTIIVLIFWVANISYWIYISATFDFLILNILNVSEGFVSSSPLIISIENQIMNASWFYVVESLSVIGLLIAVRKSHRSWVKLTIIIEFIMIALICAFLGFGGIGGAIPYRWFLLFSIFFAIIVSFALDKNIISIKRSESIPRMFVLCITGLLIVPLIISPLTSFDNPIGENLSPSTGFKNSEIIVAKYINNHFSNSSMTLTDYYYQEILSSSNLNLSTIVIYGNDSIQNSSNLIVRTEIMQYPYYASDQEGRTITTNVRIVIPFPSNQIFASNTVNIYYWGNSD